MVESKSCSKLRRNFVKALTTVRKAEKKKDKLADKLDTRGCG